ncbi:putative secreted protein (Por secretion system target) [Nonlabens dokdonensis]|uniref:Cell wall surface anchor family protein n=2 Tax=Nonlabens dokdonensis TaxID=328515 RepID=L7W775_NONDD|nr:T9SS type A sorting domain-containing protein [Nonlabens dokdonensis]AGC77535.1 cell wall surface anchor family protein [Nonlabens dokdonensis DSW-6]PZX39911.1 putative secreted protein (Por secretion system target) [Nonlabens dokdonensis]
MKTTILTWTSAAILLFNVIVLQAQVQLGNTISSMENSVNQFGRQIELSDDGLSVAISGPGINNFTGLVRIYDFDQTSSSWIKRGNDILGQVNGGAFGSSIGFSGDGMVIIIGSENSGRTEVFEWDAVMNNWTQKGSSFIGNNANNLADTAISGDGNRIAVAASNNFPVSTGSVRIFEWDNVMNDWNQVGQLLQGNQSGDRFGDAMSFSDDGNTIAIGAYLDQSNVGSVKIFSWNNLANTWDQRGNDLVGESFIYYFGDDLDLSSDGSTIIIAARSANHSVTNLKHGHAKVYQWAATNQQYIQKGQTIEGDNDGDRFGQQVAISGDGQIVVVSADVADTNGFTQVGYVKIFQFQNNSWTELVKMDPSIIQSNLFFGSGIDISSNGRNISIGREFRNPFVENYDITSILSNSSLLFENIKLYPNPTHSNLFIESQEELQSMEFFDLSGKRLFSSKYHVDKINLERFSQGIYLIKLTSIDGDVLTRKVIKN